MAEEGKRKFKRVLLKLSGEALREPGSQDNISPPIVENIASQIKLAHQNGLERRLLVEVLFDRGFIPNTKEIAAIPVSVPLVTDNGETTMERRLKSFTIAALQSLRKFPLLDILLPLVDGLRDNDAFEDLNSLSLSPQ